MRLVKATTESATRGLDMLGNRYTAMIAGFAGSAMMREFAQVDCRMTRIGIAAEKTRDEMAQMLNGIQDTAIKFKVDDSELISAVEKVGTVTGEIEFGIKNKDVMAASIAASGSEGEFIGSLFSLFTKFGIKNEDDSLKAMDTLNLLGKEGAYKLKDFAEKIHPWDVLQSTQNAPFVPQQLQGEIRVVVEGDARVKSVRVDQPGVRLSAQAGVTSVEQS